MTDWEKRARSAETTCEVLRKKVKSLYQGEASSTLQKQLERTQKRQDEATRRRELIELRAGELAKYTEKLERDVADRTRALSTILDNVTSGLLVVDPQLRIAPGYTKSCHALLDTTAIEGRLVHELLGGPDARQATQLRLACRQVFADLMPEDVSVGLVPKSLHVGGRVLHADARCIRVDGTVTAILLTLNDATPLDQAQRAAHDNRVLVGILLQRHAFSTFIGEFREQIAAATVAVLEGRTAFCARILHTLKGNAAAFELDDIVAIIHDLEDRATVTIEDLVTIEDAVRSFLDRYGPILHVAYDTTSERSIEVSETRLQELVALTGPADVGIRKWTAEIKLRRVGELVGPLGAYAVKLGERLEKKVSFLLLGEDVLVDAKRMRAALNNLPHLLRNAIDHGLELPDARAPKPEIGTVTVAFGESDEDWTITVSDDGCGIDVNAVACSALERGVITKGELARMDRSATLELICRDGVSTASRVTDVSGRGVGMAAVKSAIDAAGGSLVIESSDRIGTRISISIPKPDALAPSSHGAPPSTLRARAS